MTVRDYALLTEEQQAALEPMAAALRRAGIEPRYVLLSPGCPGFLRKGRQQKARAYKLTEAARRRIARGR